MPTPNETIIDFINGQPEIVREAISLEFVMMKASPTNRTTWTTPNTTEPFASPRKEEEINGPSTSSQDLTKAAFEWIDQCSDRWGRPTTPPQP